MLARSMPWMRFVLMVRPSAAQPAATQQAPADGPVKTPPPSAPPSAPPSEPSQNAPVPDNEDEVEHPLAAALPFGFHI